MPEGDLRVRIIDSASTSHWRDLGPGPFTPADIGPSAGASSETAYGLAVDLGTTHISLSLWDLNLGSRLAGRIGLNPQSICGQDVVTLLDRRRAVAG